MDHCHTVSKVGYQPSTCHRELAGSPDVAEDLNHEYHESTRMKSLNLTALIGPERLRGGWLGSICRQIRYAPR
jgi:hypothetical protein